MFSIEDDERMTGRQLLVERLQKLMEAKGWKKPDSRWNIAELHAKVGGSRAWLYKVVDGTGNFSIDEYERILGAFDVTFEFVVSGMNTSSRSKDAQNLHWKIDTAIENAAQTGSLEAVTFAIAAITDKTIADRKLQDEITRKPRRRTETQREDRRKFQKTG